MSGGAGRGTRQTARLTTGVTGGSEGIGHGIATALAGKGARVTRGLTLPGRCLVLVPLTSHIGVSRKIEDDKERRRLKRILESGRGLYLLAEPNEVQTLLEYLGPKGVFMRVYLDTQDGLRRQPGGEQVAFPLGERIAAVGHQVTGRDCRPPDCGLGELRTRVVVWNRPAIVMFAVGNQRVAVVGAAPDEVQLVAASGPHLDQPELAVEVERQAQRVAVPQRPDLGIHALVVDEGVLAVVVDERVVLRHRTVIVKAHDLADVALHVL